MPPFVDGGYVFCAALVDGGSAHWMCQPGTYLCDLSGNPGNCFQCVSDSDCADQSLPTYDPNRPHCDVQSGVPGYQNFCQQCTGNADCTSNPAGPLCDLNPSYPPDSLQTSIDTVGFETCGRLQTDCRLDGGPLCRRYNQICNPVDGQCLTRSGACTTDQDCLGLTSETGLYVLAPYCVAGTCRACDGGVCPDAMCDTDAECGNPTGSASGLLCNLSANQCNCDDNSQCGGFWPVCLPFTANLSIGSYCGCDSDQECGDGGLVCLADLLKTGELTGVCGLPCSSPSSPLCAAVDEFDPICEPDSGYCEPCASDVQCHSSPLSGGPSCQTAGAFAGMCGCALDSDCPTGETCQGIGACAPALDRCSPASCPEYSVCDWDSGECLGMNISRCFDDYDCASQGSGNDPFCQNGACVGCRSSSDCVNTQDALYGYPYCCLPGDPICSAGGQDLDYSCQNLCQSDQDCFRVPDRPSCVAGDGGYGPHCGCGSDVDCVGNSRGPSCNLDPSSWNFGGCDCTGDSDCPAGASCQVENMVGYCNVGGYCFSDAICPAQYACDPSSHCRPRCDTGNSCQGPDQDLRRRESGRSEWPVQAGGHPGRHLVLLLSGIQRLQQRSRLQSVAGLRGVPARLGLSRQHGLRRWRRVPTHLLRRGLPERASLRPLWPGGLRPERLLPVREREGLSERRRLQQREPHLRHLPRPHGRGRPLRLPAGRRVLKLLDSLRVRLSGGVPAQLRSGIVPGNAADLRLASGIHPGPQVLLRLPPRFGLRFLGRRFLV